MPTTGKRTIGAALAALGLLCLAPGAARGADPGPYVALGDSYTAAPLVLNQVGEPIGCSRSDHNYPSLVRAAVGVAAFRDASCSAATTAHMRSPQEVPLGVHRPQFDALDAGVNLVTVGIGGNDVGLVGAAITCLQLGALAPTGSACRDRHRLPDGGDALVDAIAATAPKIAETLDGIHGRAPEARVLLVGYPAVAPRDGRACYPLVPLSADDLAYFDMLLVKTNEMLAAQAAAGDAEFVDTFTDSVGHDVCTLPGARWFEGVVPTSPAFPVHPNALGEESMARSLQRVLGAPRPGPVLSALARTQRSVRLGRAARFTYGLSRRGSVTFAIARSTAGRRLRNGFCATTRQGATGPRCRRYVPVRTVAVDAIAGDNSLTVSASVLRRRAGLFRLTATVSGGPDERTAPAQVVHFRVKRR